jgi:hypothetical protein
MGMGVPAKGTCVSKMKVADPSTLPACCQAEMGKAHCVQNSNFPSGAGSFFTTCDSGGVCVPDTLLESGGATPKACMTKLGAGVCMSKCIPQIGNNEALLAIIQTPGQCASDELCTPCNDPRTGMPTGACVIGTAGECP